MRLENYLIAASRRIIACGRPLGVEYGGPAAAHIECFVALPRLAADLVHARRSRDRALAAGRDAQAQKHAARLNECEQSVLASIELINSDPAPSPAAASRAEIRQRCLDRQRRVAELMAAGRTQAEIASVIGCHTSTIANDALILRRKGSATVRTRPEQASAAP